MVLTIGDGTREAIGEQSFNLNRQLSMNPYRAAEGMTQFTLDVRRLLNPAQG
jgi:hypothetical protein